MVIKEVSYTDFRNMENAVIELSPGTNVLWGDNAQGKTNILEGIYFFARGKSFRASAERELVRIGAQSARAEIVFRRDTDMRDTFLGAQIPLTGKKRIERNGVTLSGVSEMIGDLCAVLFCPAHLSLVSGAPGARRSFLDIAIAQLSPIYIANLRRFNRLLEQRNALIKSAAQGMRVSDAEWESYAAVMARCAAYIAAARHSYISFLAADVTRIFSEMTGEAEKPELFYKTNLLPAADAAGDAVKAVGRNGAESGASDGDSADGFCSAGSVCGAGDAGVADGTGDAGAAGCSGGDGMTGCSDGEGYADGAPDFPVADAADGADPDGNGFIPAACGQSAPEVLLPCDVREDEAAVAHIEKLLCENTDREVRAGSTLYGVHKDDLTIRLNSLDARAFASQGQTRSLSLAMKLAEGEICRTVCGEYPVFLLDDVLSELDAHRREYILGSLAGRQIIVTSCEPELYRMSEKCRLIRVEGGKIINQT